MHKHKLDLTKEGCALVCILPDCRTDGKPFVVAGGDGELGEWGDKTKLSEIKVVAPDYQEISLCDICELSHTIVGDFIKEGEKFCAQHAKRESIYRLPNCYACGRAIRIHIVRCKKDEGETNRFCTNCGVQVLNNGKLVTK